MIFIMKHVLDRKLIKKLMRQLRRTIVIKRDFELNIKRLLIVNNKINVDFRYKCERFYEVSQNETCKSLYV